MMLKNSSLRVESFFSEYVSEYVDPVWTSILYGEDGKPFSVGYGDSLSKAIISCVKGWQSLVDAHNDYANEPWWQVLKLSPNATHAEVEASYRELAAALNPDSSYYKKTMTHLNAARDAGLNPKNNLVTEIGPDLGIPRSVVAGRDRWTKDVERARWQRIGVTNPETLRELVDEAAELHSRKTHDNQPGVPRKAE